MMAPRVKVTADGKKKKTDVYTSYCAVSPGPDQPGCFMSPCNGLLVTLSFHVTLPSGLGTH